jgi:hypothetical protein
MKRRQRAVEEERERRRRAMGEDGDEGGSVLVRFLVVGGVLGVAGLVGGALRNLGEVGVGTAAGGGSSGAGSGKRKQGGGGGTYSGWSGG